MNTSLRSYLYCFQSSWLHPNTPFASTTWRSVYGGHFRLDADSFESVKSNGKDETTNSERLLVEVVSVGRLHLSNSSVHVNRFRWDHVLEQFYFRPRKSKMVCENRSLVGRSNSFLCVCFIWINYYRWCCLLAVPVDVVSWCDFSASSLLVDSSYLYCYLGTPTSRIYRLYGW